MSVPIATIVLTTVLLGATMFKGKKYNIPTWKSSQLASMLSLDGETRTLLGELDTHSRMEREADDVYVQLKDRGGTWLLEKSS